MSSPIRPSVGWGPSGDRNLKVSLPPGFNGLFCFAKIAPRPRTTTPRFLAVVRVRVGLPNTAAIELNVPASPVSEPTASGHLTAVD
jgi:hypothetical protein